MFFQYFSPFFFCWVLGFRWMWFVISWTEFVLVLFCLTKLSRRVWCGASILEVLAELGMALICQHVLVLSFSASLLRVHRVFGECDWFVKVVFLVCVCCCYPLTCSAQYVLVHLCPPLWKCTGERDLWRLFFWCVAPLNCLALHKWNFTCMFFPPSKRLCDFRQMWICD